MQPDLRAPRSGAACTHLAASSDAAIALAVLAAAAEATSGQSPTTPALSSFGVYFSCVERAYILPADALSRSSWEVPCRVTETLRT